MLRLPATLESPLFAFLLQISLGPRIRGGGRKNKFQEKSIIKIPYPTPPRVANWYSAGSLAPLWCSQSPTRRERTESRAKPPVGVRRAAD